MTKKSRIIYSLSFVIAGMGFMLPFWPLCLVGIALSALTGRYIFAVCTALLLDVAWGTAAGILHYVYVTFTIFAVVLSIVYAFSSNYFLDHSHPDTL